MCRAAHPEFRFERAIYAASMPSITGRSANFISRRLPGIGRAMTKRHVKQFTTSGGQKGNRFLGKPAFLLDVVGRSSGERRQVMLMYVSRGDDLIVVGSNGGNPTTPNWYRNLVAAGSAEVQVGERRWATVVRELDDGPERDECWALATEAYPDFGSYRELTDRRIPVAVLEPLAAPS